MNFFSKLFGSNKQEIRKLQPIVDAINSFGPKLEKLTDDELKSKTQEFKDALAKGKTLDDILPEAFAVVREAAWRVIGERHFDTQLLGGIALHQGKITEMKTGEGKTLTSTLPVYLNALTGEGVHLVTVNDYLAKRDCNWMGAVFHFLGISTACIVHDASYLYEPKILDTDEVSVEMENLKPVSRREAYNADITYGTNNEYGFDYLRDNMVQSLNQMVQRRTNADKTQTNAEGNSYQFNYCIVDEADSILIDEARTPLIISAPDSESTKLYQQFAHLVPRLKKDEDYQVDEKMKAVTISESGISKMEEWLGVGNIYESGKVNYVHHLEQALKAEAIFQRDRDYVVKDNEVLIVDDFTGRLMPGRRYSEGLHQAIEAKEGVEVQKESRTLATITFQNYFRMYKKIAGMTGTALTSAEELFKVYNVEVLEIPTNKPMIRKDLSDMIYKSEKGKFDAIVERIREINKTGQPVLVGTIAIEKSEYLSSLLVRHGIEHEVLNAKNHEKEAHIIAKAGEKGSVTIATNMAGRGTDIKLGEGVRELGGLYIIGTERHEARRIDNQLRGRAGRQGDPGVSQFYVSLEDELMRRFGGDKLKNMMTSLGLPEDQPIQNGIISRTIENAQSKIEGFNFDIRKHVLDYDDVMNKQREVIYKKRREILDQSDVKEYISESIREEIENMAAFHLAGDRMDWDTDGLAKAAGGIFPIGDKTEELKKLKEENGEPEEKIKEITEFIFNLAEEAYKRKEEELGAENMRSAEKMVALQTIDNLWMNHLDEIDYLREGIGLRGYGQRDPLIEYKREAFRMFSDLMNNIRATIVGTIFRVALVKPQQETERRNLRFQGADENASNFGGENKNGKQPESTKPFVNEEKVGRNDPCPCGSGKKYKKCHGK